MRFHICKSGFLKCKKQNNAACLSLNSLLSFCCFSSFSMSFLVHIVPEVACLYSSQLCTVSEGKTKIEENKIPPPIPCSLVLQPSCRREYKPRPESQGSLHPPPPHSPCRHGRSVSMTT